MLRLAALPCLLIACASGGSESPAAVDARAASLVDAFAPRPPSDAMASDCLPQVPSDYGTPPVIDDFQSQSAGNYTYFAELVDEPFQRLFISLHPQTGVFPGAVVPGSYVIEAEETDFASCGACVYLAVDDGETPSTLYMAQSAKLELDSVSGSEIHGTLTVATLRQIDLVYSGAACPGEGEWPCGNTGCSGGACGVQVEVPSCTTTVSSLSF